MFGSQVDWYFQQLGYVAVGVAGVLFIVWITQGLSKLKQALREQAQHTRDSENKKSAQEPQEKEEDHE